MCSKLTSKNILLRSFLSSGVNSNLNAKEGREHLEIARQNYSLEVKSLIQWQPCMYYSEFNVNMLANTL